MKVLLVDDEREILDDLMQALRPTQYQFTALTNPLEALELFRQEKFDVVISDIRMPEMDGIELLKRLREFDPAARVIIITAFGDLKTAQSAINNRAYAFFGKPVDIGELIETLGAIEKELSGSGKTEEDYTRLQDEYSRLKGAYDNLLSILKTR